VAQPLLVMRPDQEICKNNLSKGAVTPVKTRTKANVRNRPVVVQMLKCPSCGGDYSKCSCTITSNANRGADSKFMQQLKRKAKMVKNRLVCVELNPGPKGAKSKRQAPKKRRQARVIRKVEARIRPQRSRRVAVGRTLSVTQGRVTGRSKLPRSALLSEEEYIADVVLTSASFVNTVYNINPGNAVMFPWLSTIAANFNKYYFTKLKFHYRPIVSGYATAGQSGDIILSINPDASDPTPVAQAQVYDLQMRENDEPAVPFTLTANLGELNKQDSFYVRVGAAPANTDIKTYDAGNLNLSTVGTATSGTCGKLFVEYSVMLHSPVLIQPTTGGVIHFSSLTSTSASNLAGMTLQAGGTPALTGITASGNTITWPAGIPGNYLIVFAGQAATSWGSVEYASSTCTNLNLLASANARDAIYNVYTNGGTTTSPAMIMTTLTVPNVGGNLVYNPGTIVTSGTTAADLFIVLLPTSLLTSVLPPVAFDEARFSRLENLVAGVLRNQSSLSSVVAVSEADSDTDPPTPVVPLSTSMLEVLGEYVTRKSTSKK